MGKNIQRLYKLRFVYDNIGRTHIYSIVFLHIKFIPLCLCTPNSVQFIPLFVELMDVVIEPTGDEGVSHSDDVE